MGCSDGSVRVWRDVLLDGEENSLNWKENGTPADNSCHSLCTALLAVPDIADRDKEGVKGEWWNELTLPTVVHSKMHKQYSHGWILPAPLRHRFWPCDELAAVDWEAGSSG